jgi:hypothetical protein
MLGVVVQLVPENVTLPFTSSAPRLLMVSTPPEKVAFPVTVKV